MQSLQLSDPSTVVPVWIQGLSNLKSGLNLYIKLIVGGGGG